VFEDTPTDVQSPERDGVAGLSADAPTVVSISDIHGLLGEARSALLGLSEHPEFDPIITTDNSLRPQWAGGDEYVLVFNGDLFDRGPSNARLAEMVARLQRQAPDGHVRVTMGNHEMAVLLQDRYNWDVWYSVNRSDEQRRGFVDQIRRGGVVAAYDGYNVTYAHAGRPEPYDTTELNDRLVAAAERLDPVIGTDEDYDTQVELIEAYPELFGLDGRTGRGPAAGIAWMDFEHMPEDAPPQVIGHTRQDNPTRRGNVVCGNTIRQNKKTGGGESIIVETPERLLAIGRRADGGIRTHEFSMPDQPEPKA